MTTRLANTTVRGTVFTDNAFDYGAFDSIGIRVNDLDIFGSATVATAGGRPAREPNHIFGTYGDDEALFGTSTDDVIWGFDGNDYLYGLAGNDILDGGAGADVMSGGIGNDVYHVDDVGDVVSESPGEGIDLIFIALDQWPDLHKWYYLPAAIENAQIIGTAIGSIGGNELDNVLVGNSARNAVYGGAGNDTIRGEGGNDALWGEAGNDILDGGSGADEMDGGAGDDTYYVDHAGDDVREYLNQGTDTIHASVNYTLSDYYGIENLTLTGSAGAATGNNGNNVIRGNGENNLIVGGGGADTMFGGAGADWFRFWSIGDAPDLGHGYTDYIRDFSEAEGDRIDLFSIDANVLVAGDQAFTPIGVNVAFNGVAGALRYNSGLLEGDVNGDSIADFQIQLDVAGISAAGLIL